MFSFHNLMDPHGQRQTGHSYNHPWFVNAGHQPQGQGQTGFCPFGFGGMSGHGACGTPGFEPANDMSSPMANLMHVIHERCQAKMNEKARNNKKDEQKNTERETKSCKKEQGGSNTSKEGDDQTRIPDGFASLRPLLQDVLGGAIHIIDLSPQSSCSNRKWQQNVDCHGFESRNIKVKIDDRALLLKAFRKDESDLGDRTSSMRKTIPLPENIDAKKITCKLSPKGVLVIEAPYLNTKSKENKEKEENKEDFVKELMGMVLPGLEQLMRSRFGATAPEDETSAAEKSDNTPSGSDGSKRNEKETVSKTMPADQEVDTTYMKQEEQKFSEKSDNTSNNEMKENENGTQSHKTLHANQENEESNVEQDTIFAKDQETCKMIATEKGIPSEGITPEGRSISVSNEPTVTFPEDDAQEPEAHDEDRASSETSEDSFVLLSQLEKENEGVSIEDNNNSTNPSELLENVIDAVTQAIGDQQEGDDCGGDETDSFCGLQQDTTDRGQNTTNDSDRGQNTTSDSESDGRVRIFRLEMPSYIPESIKVNFDDSQRLLTVTASKGSSRSEVPADSITKSVFVSDDMDVNGLQCYFRDGTLTVTAPRKTSVRNIPIIA